MKHMGRNTKYLSEFIRYSALLIIPLVLGIILFFFVRQITLDQISQNGTSIVEHFRSEVRGKTSELLTVSNSILSDERILEVARSEKTVKDPLSVSWLIGSKKSESSYVDDIFLICPKQKIIYTHNAYYGFDAYQELVSEYTDIPFEQLSGSSNLGWHVLDKSYATPYYVAKLDSCDAILLVSLNKMAFINSLYQYNADLCCMFNDSVSISSLSYNYYDLDWKSPADIGRRLGKNVECFYTSDGDFTYLAVIETSKYYRPVRVLLWVFGVYFAALIIFGIIYLVLVSKRKYETISKMVNGLPQIENGDPSYEGILQAIDESLQAYKETYNDHERLNARYWLSVFLKNAVINVTDEQIGRAHLIRTRYGYYSAIIHFRGSLGIGVESNAKNDVIDLTTTILFSAFKEAGESNYQSVVSPVDSDYAAVFCITSPDFTEKDLRAAIANVMEAIISQYGTDLTCLVGSHCLWPEDISHSYRSAVSLMNFVRVVGSEPIVLFESDMSNDADELMNGDFLKQLQILSGTIQLEHYDVAAGMTESILETQVTGFGKHFSLADQRLSTIRHIVAEALLSSGINDIRSNQLLTQLNEAKSIQEMAAVSKEIFATLEELKESAKSVDIVSIACEFIKENMANADLSVPEISEAINISVQHLSRCFRRKMNITVIEYINATRIEKAKEMLLSGDDTISKISEACGYNNTVTFTRNFHRHVGMSPSEFKALNKK